MITLNCVDCWLCRFLVHRAKFTHPHGSPHRGGTQTQEPKPFPKRPGKSLKKCSYCPTPVPHHTQINWDSWAGLSDFHSWKFFQKQHSGPVFTLYLLSICQSVCSVWRVRCTSPDGWKSGTAPQSKRKPSPKITIQPPFPSQSSFSNYPQSTTALVGKGIQGWVFSASAKAIHNLFSWTFSKWVPFYKIPTLPIPWNTEISLGGGHSQADMGGKSHSAKQEMGKRSDFVFLYHFAKASWWGGRGQ